MSLRYFENVVGLTLDSTRCSGCGRCLEVCPHAVFRMENQRAVVADRDACMECGACARNCSLGAIAVQAGVGCAIAIRNGLKTGGPPSCDCTKEACC